MKERPNVSIQIEKIARVFAREAWSDRDEEQKDQDASLYEETQWPQYVEPARKVVKALVAPAVVSQAIGRMATVPLKFGVWVTSPPMINVTGNYTIDAFGRLGLTPVYTPAPPPQWVPGTLSTTELMALYEAAVEAAIQP